MLVMESYQTESVSTNTDACNRGVLHTMKNSKTSGILLKFICTGE